MLMQFLRSLAGRGPGGAARTRAVPLSPAVSIGMAAHGNSRTTRRALDALFASATGDFELILVDDRSPDDTLEVFREAGRLHDNTRLFSFRQNLEYCESVNAFLCHARGDRLIFLSNDIFAAPAYLRELLATAAANPDCGILHGCSNFVDGNLPLHNVPIASCETQQAYFDFAEQIASRHRGSPLVDERYLVGDAFLVSRRVIDRIGTFDTRFLGYYGDLDFGLRAQIAGFRVALERRAFAFHQKDANLAYLPAAERELKLKRRHERVGIAMGEFFRKYDLTMGEASVHDIPWEQLAGRRFDPGLHYVAPKDYSEYLLR
jgi:O-antigen biosynthesis protein